MGNKKVVFLVFLIINCIFTSGIILAEEIDNGRPELIDGKIISVENKENVEIDQEYKQTIQTVKVKILQGKYKGEMFTSENIIDESHSYNLVLKKDDKVVVNIFDDDVIPVVYVVGLKRDTPIMLLLLLFAVVMISVGKWKGVKSLVTLIITIIAIIGFFLPRVLKGDDPILMSILVAIVVTIVTTFTVSGFNRKSIAGILGTCAGVICAGVIALIVGYKANLTGLANEEAQYLMYIPQKTKFNFQGLLFASILLGTLGAVMDVSVSISSSIYEIYIVNPSRTVKQLFKSGMNIGRDVMGTMSNTLILAYAGSSLPLMLLFLAYNYSVKDIINHDIFATEIIRSIAGTIGLILAIPITSILAAILVKYEDNKIDDNKEKL